METYDIVVADTLEDGDQIVVNEVDYLESITVVKDNGAVMVKGYSHISGDLSVYILNYDQEVGLWSL